MNTGLKIIYISTLIIVGAYFLVSGLVEAKDFIAPVFTAIILSLILLPLSQKMESWGVGRGLSSLINTLILLVLSVGLLTLLSFQAKSFADKWPTIKETMKPKVEQVKSFVFEHTPISKSALENADSGDWVLSSERGLQALLFFSSTIGFIGTYLLILIYVFFLLNYRRRFREFLLRLFPDKKRGEVNEVVKESAKVTQQYLIGKLILMVLLAILYSIGLGISGVDNFILVSIIAALLTIIPYLGNILAFIMAMMFGYLTSGETGVLIGIVITFTVAQFTESYILQPYVVGDKVDLHPFFVVLGVVIGGAIWGVLGMVLAIPMLAILTVVFLHVKPLHPFGFLFSKKE